MHLCAHVHIVTHNKLIIRATRWLKNFSFKFPLILIWKYINDMKWNIQAWLAQECFKVNVLLVKILNVQPNYAFVNCSITSKQCVYNGVNVCCFALLEFIEMTARLLVRLLPLLFRRYVFKSFRHEKLLSQAAVVTGRVTAMQASLYRSMKTSLYGSTMIANSMGVDASCPCSFFLTISRFRWLTSIVRSSSTAP